MMKDNREFGWIVDLVRSGRDVEDGELLDAWNYAADGVNEMYRLCKSLLEGFREQARVMRKMDALIGEKDRQLSEKNLLIWKLNRKLQEKEAAAEDAMCPSFAEREDEGTVPAEGSE